MAASFLGFIPPPTQGLNRLGFLVPALQGLLQGQEKQRFAGDLQNLAARQSPQGAVLEGLDVGTGAFVPQSQQGRQLQAQNLFAANQPMNPFQREQLRVRELFAQPDIRQEIQDRRYQTIVRKPLNQRTAEENTFVKAYETPSGTQSLVKIDLGQPASPAERTAIAESRASMDALDNMKTLFDSAQTKTGPITGRTSPLAGLVGLTTDEQESFMAATSAFKNQVIKDITGAQMSEQEAARIMKQIPDIIDPPARWRAKWEQTKKNLEFLQRRREEVLRQSGLKVPTAEEVPTTSPVQSQETSGPSRQQLADILAIAKQELGPDATEEELFAEVKKIIQQQRTGGR